MPMLEGSTNEDLLRVMANGGRSQGCALWAWHASRKLESRHSRRNPRSRVTRASASLHPATGRQRA